ncbi:S-layer homology domain-containing protein [Paenibacillus piri]|uniref:S-layer homology domain-containing protein n=1 Tax=Paenibacillus piri TaxID=2547395 RepID=A0A4R5KUS7_9BACL|nr:S-layer homology domain-containing protein [Paenibacillus piri]TDF98878.1 S-layer homology domain-containing protein [Paenibacillus piri]
MKSAVVKKTAQVTVMMLIISVLMPVLAFAATGFSNLTYKNNSVSGTVYSDTPFTEGAQINFYDPSGNLVGTTTTSATYNVYDGVYYNYSFSGSPDVLRQTYLDLKEVSSSVYGRVYDSTSSGNSGGGGGGGGGGGIANGSSITVSSDGTIDAYALKNALDQYDLVELKLSGDVALIPAKALVDYVSDKNKKLKISNDKGTYTLPLHVLALEDIATKLSTTVDDLIIKVGIAAASEADVSDINTAASSLSATVIGNAVDFTLAGQAPDGTSQAIDLGSNYISRTIPLTKEANSSQSTAVVYDPTTKKLSFVPSLFSTEDGTGVAEIKRNSNSIYTAIELNKSFADSKGHWAQSYIDLLANKLVIDGVTDTSFEPERNITRAEFAALVVRALGLDQSVGSSSFKDVSSSDWFSSVVGAAVNAKIIDGYEDNTFRPNQPINREELAAMVVRALSYAGAKPEVDASQQSSLLAKFTDAGKIVWAQNELAVAVQAGIVDGVTDTTISPNTQATRAQSATMLKRLLTAANFIN